MSGLNASAVVRRLEAFAQGRPLPQGSTIHFPVLRKDSLIMAFVRMGGESAPWAVGFVAPGKKAKVLTVPEPRNRSLVGDMMVEFAPALLSHLRHPEYCRERFGKQDLPPLRQVWLPNPTHVEMLHFLAFSYVYTKFGEKRRAATLRALGRAAGWLFLESQCPGQVSVMNAAGALRESFVFPADDLRQQHLGFLLAWLTATGGREARLEAASAAEATSVATTLVPEVERARLEPLLKNWHAARKASARAQEASRRKIHQVLDAEIRRRLALTEQAMSVLARDGRTLNQGVQELALESRREHLYQYLVREARMGGDESNLVYATHPETDRRPEGAASRFYAVEASSEQHRSSLLHYDVELQQAEIAAGNAFRGRIVRARDEGTGRAVDPVWTIRSSARVPLRLRPGSDVVLVRHPKVRGEIVAIEDKNSTTRMIDILISAGKRQSLIAGRRLVNAADSDLRGAEVVFAALGSSFFARRRIKRVRLKDGPGAWLTHPRVDPSSLAHDEV